MSLTKEQVCILTPTELKFRTAQELLQKYNESINDFRNIEEIDFHHKTHIYYHPGYEEWLVYNGMSMQIEIPVSLSELETILQNQKL